MYMEVDHVEGGDVDPGMDTGAFRDESSTESSDDDDAGTYVSDEELGLESATNKQFSRKNRALHNHHESNATLATGLDPMLGEEV